MLLIALVLAPVILALWLPNLVELIAASRALMRQLGNPPSPVAPDAKSPRPSRLLFLVPAHNEALLISQCVQSLVSMDYPSESRRIVVIADNSDDGTAQLAREAGAECLERFDTEQRGKPRALAWALAQLPVADYDACVIIDADTAVDRAFARGLDALAPLDGIAAQGYFGMLNEWDNWLTRLAGVLSRCRYEFSYPLRDRAGLNCPLTGNGMCIGRTLLVPHGWRAFSLTENWELYGRYAAEGVRVRFASGSKLYSQEVRTMRQGQTQRSRWLAGRTWVLREWGGRILRSSKASAAEKFATLSELVGLSPVLHLAVVALAASGSLLLPPPARWIFLVLSVSALGSQVFTTIAVLVRHPQRMATLSAFARLPAYAIWRASVAIGTFLRPGSGEWRKTERH